jgi:signal transduction histidine kinase
MAPVAGLTRAAREIARTRDPGVELSEPPADDEVTELSRTLGEMLQSLDEARAETEGALARQREFVADASHELRTPLTSVLANLELLEAILEGEDRELAASALRSSRRMRRLVSDLLLLARADTDRPLAPAVVNLAAVVRDAAGEVAPLAADHLLAVARSENGPAPLVTGSADELHRLVLNLLENAVTHTPPGTRVHARAAVVSDEVQLEVTDDGPGVPAELRGRVFERFVSQRTHEASRPSTGLGLAIVEAVAQRHGGRVELGEPETGGARFLVRLPLARPDPASAPADDVPAGADAEGQRAEARGAP